MAKITIYTDGAAKGNPGNGGYGIVMMSGKHKKELSEGYRKTTNNRMELLSVIVALEAIKLNTAEVEIYSDSKYVVDAVEKGWVFGWQKKGFKGKKNVDLWQRFLKIYPKHKVGDIMMVMDIGPDDLIRAIEKAGNNKALNRFYKSL